MEPAFVIRNWKLTLVSGLLALLFGIVILIWPAATTLVLLIPVSYTHLTLPTISSV